jgi:TPR repeat protein
VGTWFQFYLLLSTSPFSVPFFLLSTAAELDHAEAIFKIGQMQHNGQAGFTRDYKKAFEFALKAASQKPYFKTSAGKVMKDFGVAVAESVVADFHDEEILGPQKDKTVPFHWYLKAALHGSSGAMYKVGNAFLHGVGCPKNVDAAQFWFRLAAYRGQAKARVEYAKMMSCLGSHEDLAEAEGLLKHPSVLCMPGVRSLLSKLTEAASHGDAWKTAEMTKQESTDRQGELAFLSAKRSYDHLVSSLDRTTSRRVVIGNKETLAEVEVKLREARSLGHQRAELALGKLLLRNKETREAFAFIRNAAENGVEKEAELILGMMLLFGDGCERDEKEGKKWLLRWGAFSNFADVDDLLKLADSVCTTEQKAGDDVDEHDYKDRACIYLAARGISGVDAHAEAVTRKFWSGPYFKVTDLFNFDSSGGSARPGVPTSSECVDLCENCGDLVTVKSCSRCKKVKYCGRECQTAHWTSHKKTCVR